MVRYNSIYKRESVAGMAGRCIREKKRFLCPRLKYGVKVSRCKALYDDPDSVCHNKSDCAVGMMLKEKGDE